MEILFDQYITILLKTNSYEPDVENNIQKSQLRRLRKEVLLRANVDWSQDKNDELDERSMKGVPSKQENEVHSTQLFVQFH